MRPITRKERYLAVIANDEDAVGYDSPITREEIYLAKIAGEDIAVPERLALAVDDPYGLI